MTAILSGLREVAHRYDGFIIDVWGVLHDGVVLFPGVVDALTQLAALDKRVALLSNSPRRTSALAGQLQVLGLDRSLYAIIVSSGEAVHDALADGADPWFAGLGPNCLQIGSIPAAPLLAGLPKRLTTVEEADFILNTGPATSNEVLEQYRPLLDAAARRRLPMICANPDLVVIVDGKVELCAGSLALYYEETGNAVRYIGKPYPAIYQSCLGRMDIGAAGRVLAIGDSFHTDMKGAAGAGLDALLICRGVHARELSVRDGATPDGALVAALAERYRIWPIGALGSLVW